MLRSWTPLRISWPTPYHWKQGLRLCFLSLFRGLRAKKPPRSATCGQNGCTLRVLQFRGRHSGCTGVREPDKGHLGPTSPSGSPNDTWAKPRPSPPLDRSCGWYCDGRANALPTTLVGLCPWQKKAPKFAGHSNSTRPSPPSGTVRARIRLYLQFGHIQPLGANDFLP